MSMESDDCFKETSLDKIITIKINTATEQDIYSHLKACSKYFVPHLNTRVDLKMFANKIFNNAEIIEAWSPDDRLIGLISVYLNNNENKIGFINNVSIDKKFMQKGIATLLMENCIKCAKEKMFKCIYLEVNKNNKVAVNFYLKFNYKIYDDCEDILKMKLEIVPNETN